jgi:parvulin-like peptidyl-prolyl isomerase
MRRRFVLLLLLPSLLGAGTARGEIIERVVAKVNGQIITLSEFQARQLYAAQAAKVDPSQVGAFLRQNNAKILQQAIDEILLVQRAEDAGQKASPQAVEEVIASIKKENNLTTEEQFQEALEREGMTIDDLKRNIERQAAQRMIMHRDIEPKISPSDAECLAEYEKLKGTEFTKPATVTLQEILVSEDAGGLGLARQLVERTRAGEDFPTLARTYSSAPSRAQGGDIGQIAKGDLNPELEKVAFALPVGDVSDPLPVSGGHRIVKVLAKTAGSVVPFETAKDQVRDRIMMSRFEKEYEAYMQDLRKNANVELRVREVPLQLSGPVPEGSLLEGLDFSAAAAPAGAVARPAPAPAPASPPASGAQPPASSSGDEISTTPQAAPEHIAPPGAAPPPDKPKDAPPPR